MVTGAAGFIASKVCEFLLAQGHTVVGIDNLNDYYDVRLKLYRLANLAKLTALQSRGARAPRVSRSVPSPIDSPSSKRKSAIRSSARARNSTREAHVLPNFDSDRFSFRLLDIEDLAGLQRLFKKHRFDAVFNLAARAGVRASLKNPHVYLTTNTHGTLNLLECQRKHGVKKQVLASTSSLYAGCRPPFREDQPVNAPLSPYAASKKGAELMAHSYHKLFGLDISVVRYFTVFGPAGRPDMSIFRFIKWIDEGHALELYGDGTQSRDFTYIDDIARGTIQAAKPLGYEIMNLGGGRRPTSMRKVIELIEKALGKKAKIKQQAPQAADLVTTEADVSKAARLLRWRPKVTFKEGLDRCIAWHEANRKWLEQIKVEG